MENAQSLRDQVVVITGGATGLGFSIASAFGRAGARIALNDLTQDRVDQACARMDSSGIVCRGYPADVRDGSAVADFMQAVQRDLGTPDVVVANAGLYPNKPFLELSEEEWDRVLDTNVKGVFLTGQAAARAMVEAGRPGQIIVMSSGAANRATWGWSHYCTSKAAVLMLAKAMALELGTYGIRVNAILPGYIEVDEGGAHLSAAYRSSARTANALGRAGTVEDVAEVALMLASPGAGFVTGAAIAVDGGASTGQVGLRPAGV